MRVSFAERGQSGHHEGWDSSFSSMFPTRWFGLGFPPPSRFCSNPGLDWYCLVLGRFSQFDSCLAVFGSRPRCFFANQEPTCGFKLAFSCCPCLVVGCRPGGKKQNARGGSDGGGPLQDSCFFSFLRGGEGRPSEPGIRFP